MLRGLRHINHKPMRIQLEYSSMTGCLHYGTANQEPDAANGYQLVCKDVPLERTNQFTEWLLEKFPFINSKKNVIYPDIITIRKEFYEFLKLDMQQVEIDMDKMYRRRVEIL